MIFDFLQIQPFLQILLAAFLGALIGLEREYKRREAGFKTFSLVALGSCLFTVIGIHLGSVSNTLNSYIQIDPGRVIQAVAVGIGFIGSGLIIQRKGQIEGLTTAAALWAAAALGIGVGVQLYFLAILGTLLTIIILAGFRLIEEKLFQKDKDYGQ